MPVSLSKPDGTRRNPTVQQILFIEFVLKLSGGLVLTIAPLTAAKVFGLPVANSGFWPRLLGAVLIGLAGAIWLQSDVPNTDGIAAGGLLIINLVSAIVLMSLLVMDAASRTKRGTIALWALFAVLLGLSLAELAYA